jgi:hypothetical protein
MKTATRSAIRHDEDVFDYYAASQLALRRMRPPGRLRLLESRRITRRSLLRRMGSTFWSPQSTSLIRTSLPTTAFPMEVEVWDISELAKRAGHTPSPRFRWRIACRSTGVPTGPRDLTGVQPSRQRSFGRRRSTAATGTRRFRRATRYCFKRLRSPRQPSKLRGPSSVLLASNGAVKRTLLCYE